MDITGTGEDTFSASNTPLQTNGWKHIAFPVDRFVFSNDAYNNKDKKATVAAVMANVY